MLKIQSSVRRRVACGDAAKTFFSQKEEGRCFASKARRASSDNEEEELAKQARLEVKKYL